MSDERKSQQDLQNKQLNQNKFQSNSTKTQDPSNKYSFNTYQMNIISGNKQVQGHHNMQNQLYKNSNADFNNYYAPNIYPPLQQFNNGDISSLLNHMYMALTNQSRLLSYLVEKNDQNFQTTSKIYDQMILPKKQETSQPQVTLKSHFKQANISSDITANDLINFLYGPKVTFKYKLIIDKNLPLQKTFYRERNFKLKICLLDENDKPFPNSNKIPISLALYTIQNPPKFLESNTLGNKMLKGYTQQDLINGSCIFQKIQIKQVTSHYRKGMLFLVAFPKMPSFGHITDNMTVDYTQIHPLVIDKVVVKAKKTKQQTINKQGTSKQKQKDEQKIVYQEQGI